MIEIDHLLYVTPHVDRTVDDLEQVLADDLALLLARLGVALPLTRGDAPLLVATLETPRGGFELR